MIQRREVCVQGRRVRFQVAGSGPPLVLVHGLSGSVLWWRRTVPALSTGNRVYMVELPGFGGMARAGRFSLTNASAWLLAWLQVLGLERIALLGHSMGGYLALQIAAARPEAVTRLVLAAPSGVPGVRTIFHYVAPLAQSLRYTTPEFLPVLAFDALRAGPATLLRTANDIAVSDIRPSLARIRAPTLLIWGDRDRLVPISAGRLMRAEIPQARLLIIPGAGHVPMYERPREFNEAALQFLAGMPVGD